MAYDENGNWVDDPPPDEQQSDPGAPNPGADTTTQGAPTPFAQSGMAEGSAIPDQGQQQSWSGPYGGGAEVALPGGGFGMPSDGNLPGAQAAVMGAPTPQIASDPGAPPTAPAPGQAPTMGGVRADAGLQGFKFPDYSATFQKQLELNDAWNKRLFDFEQQKFSQDYALRQQQFGLSQQEFGLKQQQFETSKQQFQQDFDLRSAMQKADQAYKEALINHGNVQLAQQAMRDSMTRDFQMQELGFRNQQLAQQQNIEREKLDIQRRLLPVTRTARRAATVATF